MDDPVVSVVQKALDIVELQTTAIKRLKERIEELERRVSYLESAPPPQPMYVGPQRY
jgi:vacuolar-type H+-ATPase subunit D/Vma8